jgi:glycosyltransferase involved in cell wall biosynthesis
MKRKNAISVVLPCFNEGRTILKNLEKINSYLQSNFVSHEIIAVNDGSTDKTLSELEKAKKKFPITILNQATNYGKGKAVRDGILSSNYEIVMFLDADLAIPIEELPTFIDTLNNGFDVAIASRFVPGLRVIKKVLWYRKIMENVFRILRMLIINNYDIRDTQCGFKVFKKSAATQIFQRATINRFAFDSEIIFLARKMEFSVKELPITLQNPTTSHVRIIRDPLNMLSDLLKIRFNDISGKYLF